MVIPDKLVGRLSHHIVANQPFTRGTILLVESTKALRDWPKAYLSATFIVTSG